MFIDQNKLSKIELSLRNGSNEEQASALAGIPYRDWLSYRAKRETNEPHYLSDLQDQKLRIFPLAVNKVFKSLEKDDENYPLALEVLKLRDKEWSPKGLQVELVMPRPIMDVEKVAAEGKALLEGELALLEGELALLEGELVAEVQIL